VTTVHTIQTETHGRYLVRMPGSRGPHPLLVGFHGYGENASLHLRALERTVSERPGAIASVQALSRFYTRADQQVVASWMTREDRELVIADNVAYVRSVVEEVRARYPVRPPLVFAGFSQGVAMAYRAAVHAGLDCQGLLVLAGDVPPDVAPFVARLPRVLIGRGGTDEWYTEAKVEADVAVLSAAGVRVATARFDAGHEWADEFAARAGLFLDEVLEGPPSPQGTSVPPGPTQP
jgi:predicted esterase